MRSVLRSLPIFAISFCAFAFGALARDQAFRLDRPDAQSVELVGEFNGWKGQAMARGSNGIWTKTLSLSPGTYGYKFRVNGSEWILDPQNQERKQVNGIENSSIEISAEGSPPSLVSPTPGLLAAPTPAATSAQTADIPVAPGEVADFEVPLSPQEQRAAATNGNPPIKTAKIALGLPADFDPGKSWPLLIISSTVDAPSIELLGAYQEAALAAGWVVLAADGPIKPKDDNTERRIALIEAGLDYLNSRWPAAKTWPVAAGGFSGGAKRSGYVGAALLKEKRKLIGLLMGGCNQDMATAAAKSMGPPYAFKLVPIFLSSGTTDTIAAPEKIHLVERSMKASGFRNVRFESYEGAHDVYPQHTTAALQWFVAGASSGGATPTPKSSFDTFFKKP